MKKIYVKMSLELRCHSQQKVTKSILSRVLYKIPTEIGFDYGENTSSTFTNFSILLYALDFFHIGRENFSLWSMKS